MSGSVSTHEIAGKTERGVRIEETPTDPSQGEKTVTVVEQEGEPEQIKPDGR